MQTEDKDQKTPITPKRCFAWDDLGIKVLGTDKESLDNVRMTEEGIIIPAPKDLLLFYQSMLKVETGLEFLAYQFDDLAPADLLGVIVTPKNALERALPFQTIATSFNGGNLTVYLSSLGRKSSLIQKGQAIATLLPVTKVKKRC